MTERQYLDFLQELTNLTLKHGVRVRGFHEPAQPFKVELVEFNSKNWGSYSVGRDGTAQWHYHDKVPKNFSSLLGSKSKESKSLSDVIEHRDIGDGEYMYIVAGVSEPTPDIREAFRTARAWFPDLIDDWPKNCDGG